MLDYTFEAEVIYWRGPAPFLFARIPAEVSEEIFRIADQVSYGWGCIPVRAQIAGHDFTTALFPKDGRYLLPLKLAVRSKLPPIEIGDSMDVRMQVEAREPGL